MYIAAHRSPSGLLISSFSPLLAIPKGPPFGREDRSVDEPRHGRRRASPPLDNTASAAMAAAALSSFSSLYIRSSSVPTSFSLPKSSFCSTFPASSPCNSLPACKSFTLAVPHVSKASDIDTSFFDEVNPNEDIPFDPPAPPEGYVPPVPFYELPPESEDEVAAAYEEIYGPAYSGVSVLGNDIFSMDAKVKKTGGFGSQRRKEKVKDGFEERVVQVRRVTKVVKGGKQLQFRAIVVVGNKQGQVGVGVGKAKEVVAAVEKSSVNARRNIITVPMTKYATFPHRWVMVRNC